MNSSRKRECFWLALCCAAIWLGFPNDLVSLPPAALLWPVALCALGREAQAPASALRLGWLAGFSGAIAALYWLCLPVAQVGGLPWPAALACAALIALALSFQSGLFAAAAYALRGLSPWRQAAALGLVWYLLECVFAVAAGFPWLPLAAALAPWPLLIQGAAILGAYLLGAVWLFIVFLLFSPSRRWQAAGAAMAAALLVYGGLRLWRTPANAWPEGPGSMAALMVEGNVDQNAKWDPAFQRRSLELYLRLTKAGLADAAFGEEKPLVIWPETAMPFFYERNVPLAAELEAGVRPFGCPLLFGAPGVEKNPEGVDSIFNRALLLGPSGRVLGHYDKVHLVPFGEYLPSWLKLDFLTALLQGVGVYSEGSSPAPLAYGELALGILICYEGIFPWLAQERVAAGASLLVDISNDGWFGGTPAARQHLYLTALRCVEQGRWLLRATNTGISAVADDRGRIVLAGPMFRAGFLRCRALLLKDYSIYHHLAPWLPWLAFAALCGLAAVGRAGRRV